MGTKNNPGQFDCYGQAGPDEPMFVLLGRDKHAAGLVRLWALIRHAAGEDDDVVAEALACAEAMDNHRRELGKWSVEDHSAFQALFLAASITMSEHPDGFEDACACFECRSLG